MCALKKKPTPTTRDLDSVCASSCFSVFNWTKINVFFNIPQLFSMIDMKPPISRAKMMSVTKAAIKAIKVNVLFLLLLFSFYMRYVHTRDGDIYLHELHFHSVFKCCRYI